MDSAHSLEAKWKKYSRLTLPCHKSAIHSVRWSPNGSHLASGGTDNMVHLHRATESDLILETRYSQNGHTADVDQISWNCNNPNQLASAGLDRSVKIWDIRYIDPIATTKLKNENITVNWAGNGHAIAVVDRSDLVSFLDARMSFKVCKEHKFSFEVSEITWNKENDLFFVTSGDGKIHVLSYPDLQTLMVIDAFSSPCVCIRFDPTGKHFAVGSHDAVSSIWDTQNLACVTAIERLEWPIKTISFSHDSKYLASGSEDRFIDIANVRTGEQVMAIDVKSPTLTLDFHPKDHILAYALQEQDYRDVGAIKVVGFPEEERQRRN